MYKSSMIKVAVLAMLMQANAEGAVGGSAVVDTNTEALSPEQQAANEQAAVQAREALHTTIKANFDNKVDVADTAFHFRKVKDEQTKLETKRPTVTLPIPAPSVEGIIAIIENGGKGLELLLEAVRDKVIEQAREIVNEKEDISAENFPFEALSWEAIANLPKAQRRGGGISKELWDDFAAEYIAIMPGITGKSKDSVELAAKVFTTKFANAKTNKPVLKLLQQQLALFITNTTRGEEMAPVVDWLNNKLETLINTDETSLLLNL